MANIHVGVSAAQIGRLMLSIALGILVISSVVALAQQPSPPASSGTPIESFIPLSEINDRADEVKRTLREISGRLVISQTEDQIKATQAHLDAQSRQTEEILESSPSLYELRDLDWEWRRYKDENTLHRKRLTQQINTLENDISFLKGEQSKWSNTLNQIADPAALEVVFDTIKTVLTGIDSTILQAREKLSQLLALQARYSQQDQLISGINDKIIHAKQLFQGSLLVRDQPPLWRAVSRPNPGEQFSDLTQSRISRELIGSSVSIKSQQEILIGLFLVFIFLSIGLKALNRSRERLSVGEPELRAEAEVLNRPFSIALLLTLFILFQLLPVSAGAINTVASLLLLIPVLCVIRLMIAPFASSQITGYAIAAFSLTNQFRKVLDSSPFVERLYFIAVIVAALVFICWVLWYLRYRKKPAEMTYAKVKMAALWVSLVILSISLVANFFGYVILSKVLGDAVLRSAFLGLILYGLARIVIVIVKLLLRTDFAKSLKTVRANHALLDVWATRICKVAAWSLGIYYALGFFTIRDNIANVLYKILNSSLTVGALNLSLGDVLAFISVIAAAYLISKIVRIFLQEDVLRRLPLERGVPRAIATTIYYAILLFGFAMALMAAGLDLSKLTILTGAFGIGIGFGLQTIFNNFVSGLILLFERPIRIGDTLEIGGIEAQVKRIGIRSCTMETPYGAELIVPNSKLISDQFINWTLSDRRRRVGLKVRVAYGSDLEQVLKILVECAKSHSDVLSPPEPIALFLDFEPSSVDFELRFWTFEQIHLIVKSQIAVAIASALDKAGIAIPYPQQDLHLKSVDASVTELLTEVGGRRQPGSDSKRPDELTTRAVAKVEAGSSDD
ncbi:MAG: mechanosensitive ion channel [Acidobacteria bacterium]|nr:mechanosensitive ion channel [Acidobacteriota bacterium]